jgi:glycosyltransferase involved in cell wall biosynthesis
MINKKITIGIDALAMEHKEGISTVIYLTNVVNKMAKLRPNYKFIVFLSNDNVDLFKDTSENITLIPIVERANPLIRRVCKEQLILPVKAFQQRIDLLWGAFQTIPLIYAFLRNVCVVTMYDLRFVDVVGDFSLPARLYRDAMYGLSAKFSSDIITISKFTKQRVVEHWGIDEKKVHAVYLGSAHEGRAKPDNSRIVNICRKYQIYSKFILTTANLRNKNAEGTFAAFSKLPNYLRNRYKLVVIGAPKSYKNDLNLKAGDLGIKDEVILLSHISHDDVWVLQNGASAFVFLSWYEGFGLPVLDSMKAGVPVVCSNLCSLPELIEDNYSGILVDPNNSEHVATAIERVLTDALLNENLIKAAHLKALEFSWENTAMQTITIFDNVIDRYITGKK